MPQFGASKDLEIRKPAVVSLASAQAQFNHWLSENTFESLRDGSGAAWQVKAKLDQGPGPNSHRGAWYQISVEVAYDMNISELLKTKILDISQDRRLINLIGDEKIPLLKTRLGLWSDSSFNVVMAYFRQAADNVKNSWPQNDFRSQKRRFLGAWLDSQAAFGSRTRLQREKA